MIASLKGHKEVVKLLLDHGADKSAQDKVSVTDIAHMIDIYVCAQEHMISFTFYDCLFAQ